MSDFSVKLKEARLALNMTIEDVTAKTKIRPHIITALEEGNYSILPDVYIKSFIKTYSHFLKIPENDSNAIIEEITGKFQKSVTPPPPTIKSAEPSTLQALIESSPLFKGQKKPNKYKKNLNILNYLIYSLIGISTIAVIYFTIFDNSALLTNKDEIDAADTQQTKKIDTTVIKAKDKNLFSYFENQDSLTLEAVAVDTAWVQIEIDGEKRNQLYMFPGNENRWSAKNFFIISIGNCGALRFKRNGTEIPSLGKRGSVVKNIKITRSEVINPAAFTPATITPTVQPEYKKDTLQRRIYRKREPKKVELPKRIEAAPFESKPYKPTINEENKKKIPPR